MTEGRDIRELTRAVDKLRKVIEVLNSNLVAVYKATPSTPPSVCARCSTEQCSPGDAFWSLTCKCCQNAHSKPENMNVRVFEPPLSVTQSQEKEINNGS